MNETTITTDYEAVKQAFAALKKQGYTTRLASGPSACCGSCMAYEIGEKLRAKGIAEDQMKSVYFSRQSLKNFDSWGNIEDFGLWVNWSAPGNDAKPIVEAFEAAGLKVTWSGDEYGSVGVFPALTRQERHAAEKLAQEEAAAAKIADLKAQLVEAAKLLQTGVEVDIEAHTLETVVSRIERLVRELKWATR
jgi:hypothetical protein